MVLKFLKSGYSKLVDALSKTRSLLGGKIREFFVGKISLDQLEELERILYEADLGVQLASSLTEKVKAFYRPEMTSEDLIQFLKQEILALLPPYVDEAATSSPHIILVVGVNGNGKTTSTAKIAKRYLEDNKKVLLGAGDTFRAAATEQLEMWAHRLNVDIVKGQPKSDPAAITFDAVSAGKTRGMDVVLIDTAGRLHTKTDLMQELNKIRRSCQKVVPEAPHETLLILDATTGQNAIDQAKTFSKYTPITGLVLTKLDGTAKGGVVIAIQNELKIPVKFIGLGEGVDDLQPFDPKAFVDSLFT